eukprot:SAG31_NODE_38860_length_292_cov_2.994819_1_plen_41_part_10
MRRPIAVRRGTEDAVRVERDGTRSKFEGMPHTVVFVLLITV